MTLFVERQINYPDSDGQLMADNTKQFRWIVFFKENLECLFANNPDVFVAGDLLWYPVEGQPDICTAPDVLVAFSRTRGDRGSYRQWQEDNIPPQVVFEILSPSNTLKEMIKKQQFYDRYGVEEYYIYDPNHHEFTGLQRREDTLTVIEDTREWLSPRLGIRFVMTSETLEVYYPDGSPFLTTIELKKQVETEKQRAEIEKQRADSAELELAKLKQFLQQNRINLPDE